MQIEITAPRELLDANGHITKEGWARKPYWRYDRSTIKAPWYRIKEWDYYAVLSPDKGYGITFTIADMGYLGLAAVCWLDFKARTYHQLDTMRLLPMGRLNFPSSSGQGDVAFADRKLRLKFELKGNQRILSVEAPGFLDKGLTGSITLHEDPAMDSMVIATSWKENRRAFYYNRKINCMRAQGSVTIGDTVYHFAPETDFGGLDWGRGNWTYKNRWYWGSASGLVDGEPFGWNIGYGFSDRSPASENMLFYKGKAHKLDQVTFHSDPRNYLAPWRFTSNDGRFELAFAPVIDRFSSTDFIILKSIQHQVFGNFTGDVILDDGTKLHLDNFLGFAEDVLNWL